MRQRNNWEGADSVYDAWLLSNNMPRKWFPYKKFISMFPEWEQQMLLIYNREFGTLLSIHTSRRWKV